MIAWEPAFGRPTEQGLPPFAVEAPPTAARFGREVVLLIGLAAVIAFLVKTFVAQAFYIPSESMLPQLQVNDRVVVSKLSYRLHEPRRGDIVVFDNPREVLDEGVDRPNLVVRFVRGLGEAVGVIQPSTEEFIKRVVALPGESVEGKEGRVYVDGRLLLEPYLPPGTTTADFPTQVVPPDHLFVMGDNRANSSDSRVFGPIPQSSVQGRTVMRVWPPGSASFL